jgi:hypothetical protein
VPDQIATPSLKRGVFLALVYVLLVGCSSLPPIATDTNYENVAGASGISTYRVEFQDMPEFLKPMLRDAASIVLSSKGLDYTEGDAHAVLLMSFVPKPLTSGDESRDDFSGALSPGGDTRFIAEVHVDLKNSVTGERIWSGMLSRYHSVSMGTYMHDAPARVAMSQAFVDLFANYPYATTEQL